jgi:hypothetical protein
MQMSATGTGICGDVTFVTGLLMPMLPLLLTLQADAVDRWTTPSSGNAGVARPAPGTGHTLALLNIKSEDAGGG